MQQVIGVTAQPSAVLVLQIKHCGMLAKVMACLELPDQEWPAIKLGADQLYAKKLLLCIGNACRRPAG
jgi:hypothetical protein